MHPPSTQPPSLWLPRPLNLCSLYSLAGHQGTIHLPSAHSPAGPKFWKAEEPLKSEAQTSLKPTPVEMEVKRAGGPGHSETSATFTVHRQLTLAGCHLLSPSERASSEHRVNQAIFQTWWGSASQSEHRINLWPLQGGHSKHCEHRSWHRPHYEQRAWLGQRCRARLPIPGSAESLHFAGRN